MQCYRPLVSACSDSNSTYLCDVRALQVTAATEWLTAGAIVTAVLFEAIAGPAFVYVIQLTLAGWEEPSVQDTEC
jgi:hypothetical protein